MLGQLQGNNRIDSIPTLLSHAIKSAIGEHYHVELQFVHRAWRGRARKNHVCITYYVKTWDIYGYRTILPTIDYPMQLSRLYKISFTFNAMLILLHVSLWKGCLHSHDKKVWQRWCYLRHICDPNTLVVIWSQYTCGHIQCEQLSLLSKHNPQCVNLFSSKLLSAMEHSLFIL